MSKWSSSSSSSSSKREYLPATPLQRQYRQHIVHVDSRDRLDPLIKTPNSYTALINQINSVKEMKLASAEITGSSYIVNTTNNTFGMTQSTNVYTVTLTPGNYSATAFASHVQAQILAATSQAVTVVYSSTTNKLTLTAPVDMTIDFSNPSSSAYILMGFLQNSTALPTGVGVVGPNVINLDGDPYVLMLITGYKSVESNSVSGDIFAKIAFNQDQNGFSQTLTANTFVFVSPRNIDRLNIEFRRPSGEIYDFNGKNHSFSVEFLSDF